MNKEYNQAKDNFIQHLRLRYPTSSTAVHYEHDLKQFGVVIDKPPREIMRADITEFITIQLSNGCSAATVNRRLASLSSFFEFLANDANDDHWPNPVIWSFHRVKQGTHLPRDLSEDMAHQLWQAIEQGPVRDQAMIALMLDVGLRVGEVVSLTVTDFEPTSSDDGLSSLRVRGKGNKERRVWLVSETSQLLQQWLVERPSVSDAALFITRRRRGFTRRGIQDRVKHYAACADLPKNQISCHRLRHTFARRMAEARMPLPSLSHWLGHSHLKTTQIYIDGANPDLRTDYQTAMTVLAETECTTAQEQRPHRAVTDDQSTVPECVTQARQLEGSEIETKLKGLPIWLIALVTKLLFTKQLRWQPHHRRARAGQWLGELKRAWSWLVTERSVNDLEQLSRADLNAYLGHLQQRQLSAYTIRHFLTTFFSFLKFAETEGCQVVPGLYRVPCPDTPKSIPNPLSQEQYQQLEQTVVSQTAQMAPNLTALHRAWFFILADGGLRISELQTLTISDWNPKQQTLLIRYGKGGRERQIYLTQRAAQAIGHHLQHRADQTLQAHKPLVAVNELAVQPKFVRQTLHSFAQSVGLKGVTPHRLRHTFATRLLNTGKMPVTTLQTLMGHGNLDTTMRYVNLYAKTIRSDYQAATQSFQTQTNPDWNVWGDTIEDAFEQDETVNSPQPAKF